MFWFDVLTINLIICYIDIAGPCSLFPEDPFCSSIFIFTSHAGFLTICVSGVSLHLHRESDVW